MTFHDSYGIGIVAGCVFVFHFLDGSRLIYVVLTDYFETIETVIMVVS